jgi:hypothetical protein
LCWHGYADSFAAFQSMPLTERYIALDELGNLIELSNEQESSRPKDQR